MLATMIMEPMRHVFHVIQNVNLVRVRQQHAHNVSHSNTALNQDHLVIVNRATMTQAQTYVPSAATYAQLAQVHRQPAQALAQAQPPVQQSPLAHVLPSTTTMVHLPHACLVITRVLRVVVQ